MLSAPLKACDDVTEESVDPSEVQRYFVKHGRYTAGTATKYKPSIISGEPAHQHLAKGLVIGMRFHSAPVIRLGRRQAGFARAHDQGGRPLAAFAFSDRADPAAPSSRLSALCDFLVASPASPFRKYTPAGADIDSRDRCRAPFSSRAIASSACETMPSLLLPQKGRFGLRDYEKIFCPDLKSGNDVFDMRGIDRERGCLVAVRPDQYVAHVLPLDAFFGPFDVLRSVHAAKGLAADRHCCDRRSGPT